jgi:hypothetical protein
VISDAIQTQPNSNTWVNNNNSTLEKLLGFHLNYLLNTYTRLSKIDQKISISFALKLFNICSKKKLRHNYFPMCDTFFYYLYSKYWINKIKSWNGYKFLNHIIQ